MHGAQCRELRLQVHQVVEAVHQFAQAGFAADDVVQGRRVFLVFGRLMGGNDNAPAAPRPTRFQASRSVCSGGCRSTLRSPTQPPMKAHAAPTAIAGQPDHRAEAPFEIER